MPTRDENLASWTNYDWSHAGDSWSGDWGSSRTLWFCTILPRIHFLLPAAHVLEIAPGFGRVTAFLLAHCERYTGIDLTPRCVDACRERFRGEGKARFEGNDGLSLAAAADNSVDLAISWDSLVHAEPAVLAAYEHELFRTLVPGGRAFLHHSNLGAFRDPATGALTVDNPHWRDSHMSAALLAQFAATAGLIVDGQELLQWSSPVVSDCFSWLRKPMPGEAVTSAPEPKVHPSFIAEIGYAAWFFRTPGRGKA